MQRKTTPKVRDGRVQKKNRSARTPSYWNTPQPAPVIDKERPGRGYRHVLRKKDVLDFIGILPDWDELSKGLDAVLLAKGDPRIDGWYSDGVVGICAWERDLDMEWNKTHFSQHPALLERLDVAWEKKSTWIHCHFRESTVRAFQLLHVFLHEFGHHHDRMTTRGEGYAERYAYKYEAAIWERYCENFELY